MEVNEEYFGEIIKHLNKKKPKKGEGGIVSKPIIIPMSNDMIAIDYNYYYVTILCDKNHERQRPYYCPYRLYVEKPCVIQQTLGTTFSESWWPTQEDLWLTLQSKWGKTIY